MRDERIRVMFFTSHLGGGGAEMHFLRVLNSLSERFHPRMYLSRNGGSFERLMAEGKEVVHLSTRIKSTSLGLFAASGSLVAAIDAWRPHILYSILNLPNVVALRAAARSQWKPRTVISVQNTLRFQQEGSGSQLFKSMLVRRYYPLADRIVALSEGVKNDVVAVVPAAKERVQTIYNAGWDARLEECLAAADRRAERSQGRFLVVACGRLTEQKGYPHLLHAMYRLKELLPVELWILGEGPLRGALLQLRDELGLQEQVRFLGFQENPYSYIAAADVFVLSSLWEGFANVIVEAMRCGVPVVATDCPHGPAEILTPGSGVLVPPADSQALADSLHRLLLDQAGRDEMKRAARERSFDFGSEVITAKYEQLFELLAGSSEQHGNEQRAESQKDRLLRFALPLLLWGAA